MMMHITTLFILLWIFGSTQVALQNEISKCRLNNGDISTCIVITECPSAIRDIFLGIDPITCDDNNEICCPNHQYNEIDNFNKKDGNEDKFKRVALDFVAKLNDKKTNVYNSTKNKNKLTIEDIARNFASRYGIFSSEENDEISSRFIEGESHIGDRAAKACSRYITKMMTRNTRIESRIHGGEIADLNEFPHMALLGYPPTGLSNSEGKTNDGRKVSWRCGGSLISENYVLTAAHCVAYFGEKMPMIVRLGDLDFSNSIDGAEPQDYGIKNIILYPEYETRYAYHDIALLELNNSVQFNSGIQPACLPKLGEQRLENKELIICGWGDLSSAMTEGTTQLMKAKVKYVPTLECNKTYMKKENLQSKLPHGLSMKGHLCAQDKINGADTCYGDSGGPIQIRMQSQTSVPMYEILGVTSIGPGCSGKAPTLYVKIQDYLTWIEDIVWPYN